MQPGLVGRMDGYLETRAYYVVVRTSLRWPFFPLLRVILIDAAFALGDDGCLKLIRSSIYPAA